MPLRSKIEIPLQCFYFHLILTGWRSYGLPDKPNRIGKNATIFVVFQLKPYLRVVKTDERYLLFESFAVNTLLRVLKSST